MSELDAVAAMLAKRYAEPGERGRIVFWLDEAGDYADEVQTMFGPESHYEELRDVAAIIGGKTPFTDRYTMSVLHPDRKFVVYLHGKQPKAEDDWLLDMKLAYGPVFSADRLSMLLTELAPDASEGTKEAWLAVMRATPRFFDSKQRVEKLAARLNAHDDARQLQAKMIAVLLGLPRDQHSLQDIWRALLTQDAKDDDSGMQAIEQMGLAPFHWAGTEAIYRYPASTRAEDELTVKDFKLWLLGLAWHGFASPEHDETYYAGIRRDFSDWCHDVRLRDTMRRITDSVGEDLGIPSQVDDMDLDELATRGLYRTVDERLIARLLDKLTDRSITDADVQRIIDGRKPMLWYDEFAKDYQAIGAASALRATLDAVEEHIELQSPTQGFDAYTSRYFKVDQAYRHCRAALDKAPELDAGTLGNELEDDYVRFQLDLGAAWQRQLNTLDMWRINDVANQWDFFTNKVEQPFLKSGKKVAVIISDALRYEVAEELTRRIDEESRYTASIGAQLGVLPSYTQLGMAALLPHEQLAFDTRSASATSDGLVLADGHPTDGIPNRDAILQTHDGHAVQANNLLDMSTGEARELVKSCNVLYVYHDKIDSTGDETRSEDGVFGACETAITTLITIVKKLANANVSNFLITADHGFLYQRSKLDAAERLSETPHGAAVWMRKHRFSTGSRLVPNEAFMTYTARQAGLSNAPQEGVAIQLPNSILRLPQGGAGVKYVHGGAALQEIVVPVVAINKGRSASGDVRPVNFEIQQTTERITTGQITVDFLQNEPVGGKVRERTVFVGLYGIDGHRVETPVSNEVPLAFDSTSPEAANRHRPATFVLTKEAARFNDRTVMLLCKEAVDGSSVRRTLPRKAEFKLTRNIHLDDDDMFAWD
ncbi:BREX-1 system phosphatase PglZ type A [Bifidobacterium sp. AGR2158]|uniref:BREX-1 system phosphatase PglZ type A n=1 Tax=Bifidobacterium sp. AGR2158 TaxID=1280675 RepID=UPI00040F6672|nr:BREX-1 system phosphatase PglZ type A [Bifidobacterium sp. AGR2158]